MRVLLAILVLAGCSRPPSGPESTIARPRPHESWWVERHNQLIARALGEPIDLLFLGDSITQGWHGRGRDPYEGDGLAIWTELYEPRRAANFGMGSDRTQHLLWRIRHGELGHAQPRVIVLLIGTNNLDSEAPEDVASGVETVVDELRRRRPHSHVLLLGLLPRGTGRDRTRPHVPADPRVPVVNRLLARLDDRPGVTFLDVGGHLLDEQGRVSRAVFPDFLHLSRDGYRRWADAMEPTLRRLLDE